MAMPSIYEGRHPEREMRQEGIAFGRITRVYEVERMCEVKTFFGMGVKNDNHIPKCQWLSLDANPNGDESSIIPRVNSYCIVLFINSEPFVFGFFNPLNEQGAANIGDRDSEQLTEGDRILKTAAGNKIIVRANGIIQIQATEGCRTVYFPKQDLINTICKNYEFRASGGTIDWKVDNKKNTLHYAEYRDKVSRDNIIYEQKGQVDETANLIHQIDYGKGSSQGGVEQVVKTTTVKKDGETETFIRAPGAANGGYKQTTKPTGETNIIVNDNTTINIQPSGKMTVDIAKGKINILLGEDGKVNITTQSDTSLTVNGKIDVTASGKTTLKANLVDIDGGGLLEEALTFPSAISDFTGLPIQASSKTIKLSI